MVCDFYKDVKDAGDEKKIVQRKNRKKDGRSFYLGKTRKNTLHLGIGLEATLYH